MISIEQICRDILEQAIKDGIVVWNADNFVATSGPQELTSGDLAGVANLLQSYLKDILPQGDNDL